MNLIYFWRVDLTLIFSPSISVPFKALIAAIASFEFGISTKPKPLDVLVFGSSTMFKEVIAPKGVKSVFNSASVVFLDRFLTNMFIVSLFSKVLSPEG